MKALLTVALLGAVLLVSEPSMADPVQSLREVIVSGEADDFYELKFPLIRHSQEAADGHPVVFVQFGGTWSGQQVEMGAAILLDWEEQQPEGAPFKLYWSELGLASVGESSNNFVRKLAELFGAKDPRSARDLVELQVVSMAERPDPSRQIQLKAFYDDGDEESYAEFYLKFDFVAKLVTLSEKDPEYRQPLLKALMAKASP